MLKNPWVQCPQIPEVEKVIQDITITKYYRGSNTAKKRLTELETNYRQWISDIADLNEFEHFYFVNGVTDAINQWVATEHRPWHFFSGDYEYANMISGKGKKTDEVLLDHVLYVSNPSCSTGNFIDLSNLNVPIILDCAYIGSTKKQKINIPENTEQVWFSFSKGWGLVGQRMGVVFSKTPHKSLEPMKRVEAWNYTSVEIAHAIVENFDIDTTYNSYKPLQEKICNELHLKSADCFFIANSDDEMYKVRRRVGNIARLDLSHAMNMRTNVGTHHD